MPLRRNGQILGVIVLAWLLVGAIAAWQRGYLQGGDTTCATAGSIALTVAVGPLNYGGVNPKVRDCRLPQPSSMKLLNIQPSTLIESS